MSGFSTVDSAIDQSGLHGKLQRLCFSKLCPSATVAGSPYSLWKASGCPAAGTDPATGAGNGRVLTSASTGAFTWLNNASSGESSNIFGGGATSATASTTGTLVLCDKITDIHLAVTAPAGTNALTGVDGTSRMAATTAPGDGGMLWAEVVTAFSATSESFTYTYTNQLGTASQVTQTISTGSSAAVNRSITLNSFTLAIQNTLWLPLASGDTGVRSIQSITQISTNATTGDYNLSVVRPLGYIPLVAVSQYQERDFVIEVPNLTHVYDNSCLFMIFVPNAASTPTIFGELRLCSK